jgi:dephospho-CoA kinase
MPTQPPFPLWHRQPIFIGIAGRMGSGKTSAARYLSSKYGFQYTRYSQVLQDWLSGGGIDRVQLQGLGWDVMAGGLQAELNARLIAGIDRSRSAAIDGVRHPMDFDSLSSSLGTSFGMIFLEASQPRRFDRVRDRFESFSEFQAADSHPVESHIDSLQPLARLTISTEDSLESLYNQLDARLALCGAEDQA